jgi:hypothetical protein
MRIAASENERGNAMKSFMIVLLLLCFVIGVILFRYSIDGDAVETSYQDEFIRIEIVPDLSDGQALKESTFTLTIVEPTGRPVSGADVQVILSMPEMFCGLFPATIVEANPGIYTAVAVPVMRGNWQVEALLNLDSRTIHVKYPFKVR